MNEAPAQITEGSWPRTPLCDLLEIKAPIIQAGMVYCSGARLAAAAAEAGCLGVIGAGSMSLDVLKEQINKAKKLTAGPLAVNLPLLYPKVQEQIEASLEAGIRIFITSAGSPAKHTSALQASGCKVLHVVSHPRLLQKCMEAGTDGVIVEGFEAGGHNGREELTTLVLLQQCGQLLREQSCSMPLVAAGGIGSGQAIAAALALGADGVQIGTLFAGTVESSAHANFKNALVQATWSETQLQLKKLVPVRLLNNSFAETIRKMEESCASPEELQVALGKGRARAGMLEGDLIEGELEIGQIVSQVNKVTTVTEVVERLSEEYRTTIERLNTLHRSI